MTAERKKAYDSLYAAIGGEIRLWANPRGEWQAVTSGTLSPEADALVKALVAELSKMAAPSS